MIILPMFSNALAKTKDSSIGFVAIEKHLLNFVLPKQNKTHFKLGTACMNLHTNGLLFQLTRAVF